MTLADDGDEECDDSSSAPRSSPDGIVVRLTLVFDGGAAPWFDIVCAFVDGHTHVRSVRDPVSPPHHSCIVTPDNNGWMGSALLRRGLLCISPVHASLVIRPHD